MVNIQCVKMAHWLQDCRRSNSSNYWIEGCSIFLLSLRNHNTQNDLGNSVICGTAWFGCFSVRVQTSGWVRGKHICAALRVSGDRVPEAATIGLLQKIQERIRNMHEVRLSKRNCLKMKSAILFILCIMGQSRNDFKFVVSSWVKINFLFVTYHAHVQK